MARDVYYVEELDDATARYLHAVRASKGNGMAGIYVPVTDLTAGCGLIVGLTIIVTVFFLVSPPLNDPTNITLWLTAGLLLGGWMVLAAIRIWMARARGANLGSFQYVDPWNFWNVAGTKVERVDLNQVVAVHLLENRDKEGTFQNSVVTITTTSGPEKWTLLQEIGAREIHAYIEYWLGVKGGAQLSKSLVEEHAALARGYAYDQAVLPGERLPTDIPKPERVRPAGFGWLGLLSIPVAAVAIFFLVHPLVLAWRDNEIFDLVAHAAPNDLRSYLVDPRNTRHREEVKNLLAQKYEPRIAMFQERIRKSANPKVKDIAEPMGVLLGETARAVTPIVTVRVRETASDLVNPEPKVATSKERIDLLRKHLSDELQGNMGEYYVSVAEAPEDVPAHIDLEYKIVRDMGKETLHIEALVKLRKTPDDEAIYQGKWQTDSFEPFQVKSQLDRLVQDFTGTGQYPIFNDAPKPGDW